MKLIHLIMILLLIFSLIFLLLQGYNSPNKQLEQSYNKPLIFSVDDNMNSVQLFEAVKILTEIDKNPDTLIIIKSSEEGKV